MAIDFSAITDLVNATISIMAAFVTNQTTLVNFAVMLVILAIVAYVGIWIKNFMQKMLGKLNQGK